MMQRRDGSGYRVVFWVVLLTGLAFSAREVQAKKMYVSDDLLVSVRAGLESGEKIATVKSDDLVDVLEENGKYVKVRTSDGSIGWMQGQYLTDETPDPVIIAGLRKEIKGLEARIVNLTKEQGPLGEELERCKQSSAVKLNELKEELNQVTSSWKETETRLAEAKNEYEQLLNKSQKAVEVVDRFESLEAANDQLQQEVEQLQLENSGLRKAKNISWFLAGAGVFLVGWLAGKTARKRKYSSLE